MASPLDSLIQKYAPRTTLEYENALKEVMQEITLAGLARGHFFNKAAFYGGTALRIFYGLSRFSEDLDFTLLKAQPDFKLQPYLSEVSAQLQSFGFEVTVNEVKKPEDRLVESAFLKANTRIHFLKVNAPKELVGRLQHQESLQIKFEVDVQSPLGFDVEVKTLFPPISAAVTVLQPSSLFAGKMHAVLFRKWKSRIKGRDFYDLLWYLGQGIPLKLFYLEQKMKENSGQGPQLDPTRQLTESHLKDLLIKRIQTIDWQNAKQDVSGFLRDPREVDVWSSEFFLRAIQSLKCSI